MSAPELKTYKDGTQEWQLNGRLHREDGPAVIYANGAEEWWYDFKLHRKDGPAVIEADGFKQWYKHGHIHRADGPAIIHPDGTIEWWFYDKRFDFNDWCVKANISDEEKAILKLEYM